MDAQKEVSTDELVDDTATVVGVAAASQPVDVSALSSTAPTSGDDVAMKSSSKGTSSPEGPSPHGLTDQTNFLPTRQVITVFLGLSVALACAFLDQTVYVFEYCHMRCMLSTFKRCIVSPRLSHESLPVCMEGKKVLGLLLPICLRGGPSSRLSLMVT